MVGGTSSAVRNSKDYADFIQQQSLNKSDVLVPLDVISLFTKVPVSLALEIAQRRLELGSTLSDRTNLAVEDVLQLLSLCLNATFFSFRGTYYRQSFGTAMGSPVSVVIANMVMEHVEEQALSSFPQRVLFWKRYVDDVCCALAEHEVSSFLCHLNSIEPSI